MKKNFITFLYYKVYILLNINNFRFRNLTKEEIQLARGVFGDLINYNKVKIFNIKYLPWQPINMFIAPNGNIYVNNQDYRNDYSTQGIKIKGLFIHEMTHILQHQSHINVIFKGLILHSIYLISFKRYNPYKYNYIKGKPFNDYNIEQQAEIAKDIFYKNLPNIIFEKL